jgi:hypothetical protein
LTINKYGALPKWKSTFESRSLPVDVTHIFIKTPPVLNDVSHKDFINE